VPDTVRFRYRRPDQPGRARARPGGQGAWRNDRAPRETRWPV